MKNEETRQLRRKFLALASKLAQQAVEERGIDYKEAINEAMDEAAIRLGIDRKAFIKMFI